MRTNCKCNNGFVLDAEFKHDVEYYSHYIHCYECVIEDVLIPLGNSSDLNVFRAYLDFKKEFNKFMNMFHTLEVKYFLVHNDELVQISTLLECASERTYVISMLKIIYGELYDLVRRICNVR